MSDNKPIPVLLDQGLNTVLPPLLSPSGSLIDCLNYEMTTTSGYKRIDGYERYDGYGTGAVSSFYRTALSAGANQASIVIGSVISRVLPTTAGISASSLNYADVGIVVDISGGLYTYVPFNGQNILQSGETVTIRPSGVTPFTATVTVASTDGKTIITDPPSYVNAIQSYGATLRGLVTPAPGKIAGIFWLKENLFAAVSAPVLTFVNSPTIGPYLSPGSLVRTGGIIYRILGDVPYPTGTAPPPGAQRFALMPVGTSGTNNTDVVEVDSTGTAIATYGTGGTIATTDEAAYLVKYVNPKDANTRGVVPLAPAYRIPFDAGAWATEVVPVGTAVKLRNSAGTRTMDAKVIAVEKTTGSFVAGTATGYVTLGNLQGESAGSSFVDNWEVWTIVPNQRVFTVDLSGGKAATGTFLPGYSTLVATGTHYVTINANFYGNASTLSTYGATGASRGFWCDGVSYGNIYTQDNATLDKPKYVSYFIGKLALGFEAGSVVCSVTGSPLSFDGVLGAVEIATGDKLTGLLELPGNTLAVMGQSSIRRIASDKTVININSDGGCFDYTACVMGSDVLYTGPSGISLLSQTADYGDFYGEKVSDPIQDWLRPKLAMSNNNFEVGGVVCAYAVRGKNQYRLVLRDGTHVFVTYNDKKFKAMKVNYGTVANDLRVPIAWSSTMSSQRKERVHVVWDYSIAAMGVRGIVGTLPDPTRVYEMDVGWGFDGYTFTHFFDVAHTFIDNGVNHIGIEGFRLYGKSYGLASLTVKTSGIEKNFDQPYENTNQDLSLPQTPVLLRDQMDNFTTYVDSGNWGLGIKVRIQGAKAPGLLTAEPSHVCQVILMQVRTEGAQDNG
jgi:hypothetical protein